MLLVLKGLRELYEQWFKSYKIMIENLSTSSCNFNTSSGSIYKSLLTDSHKLRKLVKIS